jgi:toxin ParE1/3/4
MTAKPVLLREHARRDMKVAVSYYLREAGPRVARDFAEAVEIAYRRLETSPRIGSPRYEHALNLPGLRTLSLGRFPYLVFYVEHPEQVEIWRILHGQSDVGAQFDEPTG